MYSCRIVSLIQLQFCATDVVTLATCNRFLGVTAESPVADFDENVYRGVVQHLNLDLNPASADCTIKDKLYGDKLIFYRLIALHLSLNKHQWLPSGDLYLAVNKVILARYFFSIKLLLL